jgi:hypothetical protein
MVFARAPAFGMNILPDRSNAVFFQQFFSRGWFGAILCKMILQRAELSSVSR